jgi:CO/xanthine dehydrogenase Mo-binding subunit
VKGVFCPVEKTNIANDFSLKKGDLEAGFAKSDRVIENEFYVPQVQHVPMETHSSIAHYRPSGDIHIWTSAQSPFAVRDLLSVALDISHARIRVVVPTDGGGFGGKAGIHLEPLVAMLSKAAGFRPVKITATRTEEFKTLPCRQGLHARIKTGVTSDGRILAEDIEYVWDAGAYADYGVNIGRASGYSGAGPYDIENISIASLTVYTTKPFGTAYRGFGHVEVFWAVESHMDMIARELGMDPYEFRKKNLLDIGSRTVTGEEVTESTGSVRKCLEAVADGIEWGKEPGKPASPNKVRGKGLAVLHKAPAMPPNTGSSAIVKFNEDVTVNVMVSGVDYGQGTATSLTQIAAHHLRLPVERIHFVWAKDTDFSPYDWQTVASRFTFMGGLCIERAAADAISQIKQTAAEAMGVKADDLDYDDGRVFVRGDKAKGLDFKDVVMGYKYPDGHAIGGPVIGRGRYVAEGLTNLDLETGQGLPALCWTYGAHGVEIEIDTETGDIEVVKIVSAFDVGKVINEALCRGQVLGGTVQGLGTAVSEHYVYDGEGHLLNPSFTDYKIPTVKDVPREMVQVFIETPHDKGPFGARGVAEHPMISVPSVRSNALFDATGVRMNELPLSPERVYLALKGKLATR